jgi:oligopeptide/dipeptide ABC transporter ATP-binding protein
LSALLTFEDVRVSFPQGRKRHSAIDDIHFEVGVGETVALMGESGSGKSLIGLTALGLLPPNARVEAGSIRFAGRQLLELSERELAEIRGKELCLVLQEPSQSLNPFVRVRDWLLEPLKIHSAAKGAELQERVRKVLDDVGLAQAATKLGQYPHELAYGDRKLLMLASALVCRPSLVVLDEPTLGLDPTLQLGLMDSLERMRTKLGLSMLIISHDLSLVQRAADRVLVMYAGQIIEQGPRLAVQTSPAHPYTRGLLASTLPEEILGPPSARRLPTIMAGAQRADTGCRFRHRCAYRLQRPNGWERCDVEAPQLNKLTEERFARCHFAGDLA